MYRIHSFPSGLRVASIGLPHMESVAVGVWVGIGGRYESKRLSGLSHFIEHLLFKGTKQRTAKQITQAVEGVGGYLNAFTGEETTCYYAKASHRHLGTLLEVLADMYLHPRFAAADVAKERDVIKEEVRMYRDQPDHHVQELLVEALWPNHPLGRSLTGTLESLDRIQRSELVAFKRTNYLPANTVVAVAGRCRHDDIVGRVENAFRLDGAGRKPSFMPAANTQRSPRLQWLGKDVEQTHLAIGIHGYSRHDPRRYALKLLSIILGENMSSRLFQVIREQHGLAYSIQSSTSFFADTGAFLVSAGLDNRRVARALRLILRELNKVSRRPPTPDEMRRAKDYAIGQMRLGLESSSNQMMWIGEHLVAYGSITTPEETERRVEAVTPDAVHSVATHLFRDNRLCAAIITPGREEKAVAKLLSFS